MNDTTKPLRCQPPHVVFQECPGEVSLCYSFFGCPLRCDGCHSEELWDKNGGDELSFEQFKQQLEQYSGLITAVVFFGGEWQPKTLQALLIECKQQGLKTCLYTGLNRVSRHLRPYLDYTKVGPWRTTKGGLDNPTSNQAFYKLENGQLVHNLNHLFHKQDTNGSLLNTHSQVHTTPSNHSHNQTIEDYHAAA
mgnify:CR=1 FL=1